jgi:hypothetical protein
MTIAVVAATTTTPAAATTIAAGRALATRIGIPFATTAVRETAATLTVTLMSIAQNPTNANPFPWTRCPLPQVEVAEWERIEIGIATGTVTGTGAGTETVIAAEATTAIVTGIGRMIVIRFPSTTIQPSM